MEKVVAAGGGYPFPFSTVEVYDVANDTWTEGVDLPVPLYGAATVPFEDTFLVIGGKIDSNEWSDKVYKFNRPDSTWTEMPEFRLSEPKRDVVAMWLP